MEALKIALASPRAEALVAFASDRFGSLGDIIMEIWDVWFAAVNRRAALAD